MTPRQSRLSYGLPSRCCHLVRSLRHQINHGIGTGCFSLIGYTTCDHCQRSVYVGQRCYQITAGKCVGSKLETTLCHRCYHNNQIKIQNKSIPGYYLHLSYWCTGHPDLAWHPRRGRRPPGMCWAYRHARVRQRVQDIVSRHNLDSEMLSSRVETMLEIARLHWRREVVRQENTELLPYEAELLSVLDLEPQWYQPTNFIISKNPAGFLEPTETSAVITTMSV